MLNQSIRAYRRLSFKAIQRLRDAKTQSKILHTLPTIDMCEIHRKTMIQKNCSNLSTYSIYNYSTLNNPYDETKLSIQSPDPQQQQSTISPKIQSPSVSQPSLYINYTKIYEQNKRRLLQVKIDEKLKSKLFDQLYLQSQLLGPKYFYADIMSIAGYVIEYLVDQIEEEGKNGDNISGKGSVTLSHFHFLLYVYHLYTKEFRSLKDQFISIVDHFFYHSLRKEEFEIQKNLQFCVFLRKFIDSEVLQNNGPKVLMIAETFSNFLKEMYLHEKNTLFSLSHSQENFSQNTIKKAKFLENYLLAFPNLWISTLGNASGQQKQNLNLTKSFSHAILIDYDFFVSQFEIIFKESVQFWLNVSNSSKKLPEQLVNISSKQYLVDEFKSKQLNKCFNYLLLVNHRLWTILEIPRSLSEKTSPQNQKKSQSLQKATYQQYINLIEKYENGKINILSYLPCQRYAQNEEEMFMRLILLMKNLLRYHTLRQVDHKELTLYLRDLFEKNFDTVINSKNVEKKREIRFLLGQLISRLSSGLWADGEDLLGKYFSAVGDNSQNDHKGKRDSKGQWSE